MKHRYTYRMKWVVCLLAIASAGMKAQEQIPYKNPNLPVEERSRIIAANDVGRKSGSAEYEKSERFADGSERSGDGQFVGQAFPGTKYRLSGKSFCGT